MLLYNCFIFLYASGIRFIALWNRKARRWLDGRRDLFTQLQLFSERTAHKRKVWVHCASLGEYEQGLPVLEKIKRQYPDHITVLSFFSPSGYEVIAAKHPEDEIFYLPMDSKLHAKKFIDAIDPSLVIWVKYEYWFYYLTELKRRNIPVLLVSGVFRKNQPFFQWYGSIWKKMLACFEHLFVQTPESAALLASIGIADSVSISGDTRFDRVIEIVSTAESLPDPIIAFCGSNKVIVAGSTWPEDEEELDHYANKHPEIKFILAPHEIDEAHLKEIEKLFHHSVRYSVFNPVKPGVANVLIIDNIGLLSRLYRCADIAYIGGGFGADGIHNVLEPAVYGKPVVFGPEYEEFIEAVELIETGGGISIDNALELEKILDELIDGVTLVNEPGSNGPAAQIVQTVTLIDGQPVTFSPGNAARNYVYSKAGASKKIMDYIQVKRLLMS